MLSSKNLLVLIVCLLLWCKAQQNGTCNFKVASIDTAENVSCFRMMAERDPVCKTGEPARSCHVHKKDGQTCIKWPADIELTCLKDSEETHNLNIDENKCAEDQESTSCNGEYKSDSEPGDSASTMSLSILLITAAVIIAVVHWVSP